ncbi:MAG: hypothetical protein M0P39_11665 [Rhodocyclaceae bacterium]|nr:hypothetical protein [Rhodocyclaceae bacterium]
MTELWRKYQAWFDRRAPRERSILALTILGSILLLGVDYWAGPAFSEVRKLGAQAKQNRQTANELEAQIPLLQMQVKDPDASTRLSLDQLKKQIAEQEPRFRNVERSLVAANKMPEFLESILARNRALQLVSLHTLPPVPVIERAQSGEKKPAAMPAAGAEANLYKHGVEIRLAGSYRDLIAYLSELEKAPQQVIWGAMDISVAEYPRTVLALTVYTLSLDKAWLTL